MNAEAKRMIERLGLEPLPEEGGFFRRVWAGEERAGRPLGSAILFLMTEQGFQPFTASMPTRSGIFTRVIRLSMCS